MNGLLEILTTKKWMVSPDFAHGIRKTLERNLNGHIALEFDEKKLPFGVGRKAKGEKPEIKGYQVTDKGQQSSRFDMSLVKDPFINVIPVMGPITRRGGACSYGSAELRDWLYQAANHPYCKGHIFYIDTPGGSAWAKNDFQQAIDYAHSMGQAVIAYIDGTCASAGMWLASLCDEVYYMHPEDEMGCIGVLAAFYTEKDGEKNVYTNETYHELYDPESYDKNKWYRDIANETSDGDKLLIDDLKKSGVEFRAQIKKAFPKAQKKHIHGQMFRAVDVKGILNDGQMSFSEVIQRAFDLSDGAKKVVREQPSYPEDNQPDPTNVPDDGTNTGNSNAEGNNNAHTQTKKNTDMEKYTKTAAAAGVQDFVVGEDGSHFAPQMLDSLEQTLTQNDADKAAKEKEIADLKAQLDKATADNAAQKAAADKALADAKAAADKALADAKAAADKAASDAKEASDKALADAKAASDKAIADMKKRAEDAEQNVKDLQNQVAELTSQASEQHEPSPASNGTGTEQKERTCGMPAYDEFKTPLENKQIRDAYMASLRKQM